MSFDRKILLGFIGCSVILLAVAAISFRNSKRFIDTNRWVNQTHQVLYELEQVLLASVDAQGGVRGYLLSKNEDFLDLFNESKMALIEHINEVSQLTNDNPIQKSNLDELLKLTQLRIMHLDQSVELIRIGKADSARQILTSGEGKRLQDQIRGVISRAKNVEEGLLVERSIASENDAQNFNTLFIALLLIVAVVLGAVYMIIISNIRALRKAEEETNDRNWNLTGSSELAKQMQGYRSVQDLSQSIIDAITAYLDIPIGSLFVREKNSIKLKRQGAHAQEKSNHAAEFIALGEGLAGQAAQENKAVLLKDIHPDTYNIVTSFGNIRPKSIMVMPLNFETNVVGVIELGSIAEFTERQIRFLQTVEGTIAIALTSAIAAEEIKELLEETKRQAEELEAQQHELRQANEELLTKTDLLERSEGVLKTQQEELQQTNVELEEKANMLEEQKLRLEEAKNQIEQKAHEVTLSSRYKSEFLANMSHELRTPLNSILILSQLLSENKDNRLSDREIEHAKNIYNSGSDLLTLINEILDLSKIEAGKMSLDIEAFTLQDIVVSLRSTFEEMSKSKSIEFQVHCENESSNIDSDKQRVEQVLKNLLSNAFKFTPKGGTVQLTILYDSYQVSFAVQDTGIGIPEDKRQIIFEAFQQGDGSTKRKYGGTGLGLSISRELAAALGGKIQLESIEGKGSTFTLTLPHEFDRPLMQVTDKQVEVKQKDVFQNNLMMEGVVTASPEVEAIDDRKNIKEDDRVILIIEDDQRFALTLLNFVRERHYKGIIASQGTTGISYARHYRPDAIFLDMQLPVMHGFDVLSHLKVDPELRHIPVQIISGFDHQKKSMALGAFDYLIKPVDIADLHSAVNRIETFKSKQLKKLLVIEDNVKQNKAICELIGNGDVKSFSAYSGTEAQEVMLKENFDCIIVDLGLPDMSGFDLLEKIKADEKLRSIPVIVYTGKDLSKEETIRLNRLSDTVVIKTVRSHERLLDETILFLHRVEARLPREKQMIIRKLHRTDEVLKDKVILLVDDDIRNIYSLTNVFEQEGINCLTADNGRVALNTLNENPGIQLVLMDVMMPEMDGFEATLEIRKDERFRNLPIIALTAKAMKGDKEKCLAVGMSDYISKPVNIDQLLSLMRVWLYKTTKE